MYDDLVKDTDKVYNLSSKNESRTDFDNGHFYISRSVTLRIGTLIDSGSMTIYVSKADFELLKVGDKVKLKLERQ